MSKKENALVLLSGGQDSTTCLAIALQECDAVEGIFFHYGQRHTIEVEKARKIAQIAGLKLTEINATFIQGLTPNALTDAAIPIHHKEGELPNTFVPGRNLFFLSIAGVVARQKGIKWIYTGVCHADYSGYPDCRQPFVEAAEKAINLAMESDLNIKTPLMNLTKSETIQKMNALGKLDWYQHTHTCYEGTNPACGTCPSCLLRLKGFKESGFQDPIAYKTSV